MSQALSEVSAHREFGVPRIRGMRLAPRLAGPLLVSYRGSRGGCAQAAGRSVSDDFTLTVHSGGRGGG